MNVLPAGFTPIGMRRTITDECFGIWASSSLYSAKYKGQGIQEHVNTIPNNQNLSKKKKKMAKPLWLSNQIILTS